MASSKVTLKPVAGFCIKSKVVQPGFFTAATPPPSSVTNVLSPTNPSQIPIPPGLKVFVNVAWDKNVPPPPEGSEDMIQRAMLGEDVDETNPEGWYVPVIVSQGRDDKDKAGKPSLVFDAVYNSSLKSRTLRDLTFKTFLIELALQRIESQTSIVLSRDLGFPNIPSKGPLMPRQVTIPNVLLTSSQSAPSKPLIEELSTEVPKRKGILKSGKQPAPSSLGKEMTRPSWTWSQPPSSSKIEFRISVPALTHAHYANSTLDVSSYGLSLKIPPLYSLDIDFAVSDAQLAAVCSDEKESLRIRSLKRAKTSELDVDGAKAQWFVSEGVLVVTA